MSREQNWVLSIGKQISHRVFVHWPSFGLLMLIVAANANAQTIRASSFQAQGFSFVAQSTVRGQVGRVYYFGGRGGQLACLDGKSGRVIWSETAPGLSNQGIPGVAPVIADSTLVYMGGGGFFTAYGLDLKTGKTKWSLEKRSPALAAGPGVIFLSTQGGLGVIAVDADSGKVKWKRRAVKVGGTLERIVYSEGRVYTDAPNIWDASTGRLIESITRDIKAIATSNDRLFTANSSGLIAVDVRNGKVLWQAPSPVAKSPERTPEDFIAASNHYVVAVFYDDSAFDAKHGVLQVYNATTGQLLWKKLIASGFGLLPNPVSVDNGLVYFLEPYGSNGQGSRITAFDGQTGMQTWVYTNPAKLFGPIAVVGDAILVSSGSTLDALDRKTGNSRWKFSF